MGSAQSISKIFGLTKTISKTPKAKLDANLPFGELLVSKGLISREELEKVLKEQSKQGGRLGEVLLRLEKLNHEDVTLALAEHLSMEYIRLDDTSKMDKIDMDIARMLPESIAKRFCLVAIGEAEDKVVVVMADPLNVIAIDTVALKMKRQIKPVISSPREIRRAIEFIYHGSDVEEQQLRSIVEGEGDEERTIEEDVLGEEQDVSSEAEANKAPVIRFVDLLLSQAVKSRASDIHIEPQEKTTIVRMRIDGILRDMVPPAKKMQAAVIARIKIVARMDIAERRLPQDGRFKMKTSGRSIDVRVSVIPTIYGEKVVMRILDASAVKHDLVQLGLEPKLLEEFKDMLARPHGIMIVTGPTGSGKSTTLYSALNYVKETVEIAIKASLTGHLVLSTFHTNDAPSAISRLLYMGIERYLLASSLNLVVAQRLVRKICENCKEPITLSEEVLKRMKIDLKQAKNTAFYHGRGCTACGGTGYLGRLPIFEFLVVDDDICKLIIANSSEAQIREASRQKGYGGLLESGVNKALAGLTTAEEVISVAFTG